MRTIFVYLALLTSFLGFSQTNLPSLIDINQLNYQIDSTHKNHIHCGWSKDVHTKLSGPSLKSLIDYPESSQFVCGNGKFRVYYADLLPGAPAVGFADPNQGQVRRNTFCAVLTYIQSVFDFDNVLSSDPILIEVEASLAPGVNPAQSNVGYFAYAGPTFNYSAAHTIEGGNVFDYITTGNNYVSSNSFHAIMKVNFDQTFYNGNAQGAINWLDDYTQNITNCKIDLFSVLLHEVGHMLGFLSLANNNGQLAPQSLSGNYNFSRLDFLLHKSSNLTATGLQKFIIGDINLNNVEINQIYLNTPLNDNMFWSSGNNAPNNIPIYSGAYLVSDQGNPPSFLSHIDDQRYSYNIRARNAPGFEDDYVMGPFTFFGLKRRNFTDSEIKIFTEMGYLLNSTFANPNLNNLPPYSIKLGNETSYNLPGNFPNVFYVENVANDALIQNNINTTFVYNLWEDSQIMDPEGQILTVADGSLTNIRGCGNGENNNAQLYLSPDKRTVTFTPRANFIGRAQFAFKLYDGAKVGSWHFVTIDVETGTNVNFPFGSNLLINGNCEEGSEVRRTTIADNSKPYTSIDNTYRTGFLNGVHWSDANPYNNLGNYWTTYGGGDYIRNSFKNCNPETFGSAGNSINQVLTNYPLPNNNQGDRYRGTLNGTWFGLGKPLETCHKYILKLDYIKSPHWSWIPDNNNLTFGFCNILNNLPIYQSPILNSQTVIITPTLDSWIHIEIPFNYCSQIPTSFLYFDANIKLFVDNVEIIEVPNNDPLQVTINSQSSICIGETTLISATLNNVFCNATYLWSDGATTSSINVSPTSTQTYTVTVNDGCQTAIASSTITVNPEITPTFTQLPNYCVGQTPANLPTTSNNGIIGEWSPQVISTSTTGTTTYTFTPTSNPCASTATMTITVNPTPTLNNISSQTVCSGQQTTAVNFSGTPAGTTFVWSNNNTAIGLGAGNTNNIAAFTATNSSSLPITSTISVTPTSGTCSGTPVNFTITVNPLPTVPNISVTETSGLTPNDGIVCSGSGVTLNASGSLYPVWSTGTSSYLIFVSPTSTTTYTATVTNSNGCSSIASQVITVSPSPSVNPISNQNLCVNTNSNIINFTGTSDATFTWTNSNPSIGLNPSSGQSIPSFVALNNNPFPISGIITVTPTLNGCAGSSTSFTVTVNPYPTLSISPNPVSITAGISTPLTVTSSPSGATYLWSNGLTNSTITVSPTSTTTYTVTGSLNGCSSSASVQVIVEPIVACANCTNNNISGDAAGNISLNPAPNLSYCINNNLNITGDVTFRTSEFRIASNVTITVQPGAKLTILGCHLYSCGNMWNGIVVKPGGRLVVDVGVHFGSSGLNRFDSFIEDAKTAIQIQDNSPISSGNILRVTRVIFNRNQYSIRIGTYNQNLTTYPFSIESCIFTCRKIDFLPFNASNPLTWWRRIDNIIGSSPTNNTSLSNVYINNVTFSQTHTSAFLKAPFPPNQKPSAGIELSNVGLTLNASSTTPVYREFKMGDAYNMSIFDNLRIGVSLKNSNFTTVNSVFQNTNGSKGIGIYATAESDKNNRLQVLPVLAMAGNNKFVDCGRAISSSNYFEVNIQYSDIRSSQVDNISSTEMQGIQLASNRYKNYRILNNSLYNVRTAISMTATNSNYNISGIPKFGQYVGKINVDFNTIRPNFAGVSLSGQYVENAIFLQNIGQLTEYANDNNQDQTIISANGNTLEACRGIYYNNWYKVNSQIQNNSISVNYNQYVNPIFYGISISNCLSHNNSFIRSNTITGFYTPSTNNNPLSDPNLTGIVTSLSPSFSVTCNSTNKTVRGIGFNGGNTGTIFKNNTMQNHRYGFFLDNNGIINQQGSLTAPADNRWMGTWLPGNFKTAILGGSSAQNSKIYIRTASAYNPDGSGESFTFQYNDTKYSIQNGSLIESPNASLPILPCLQSLLASDKKIALEKVALDQIIYSEDFNNLGEKMRYINKQFLYTNLKEDSTYRDSSLILNDFYTNYLSSTYETIHWINKHLEKGDLLNAVLSNEAFVPVNNIEENFKKYHEIYIKYYQQTILNQQDSTNLKELAEKCPFSEGSVIYKARALYNLIFGKNDVFSDDCISSNFSKLMTQASEIESSDELILYPNPAKDEVYVQFNNNNDEATKLEIQVFDAMGQIVLNQSDLLVRNGLTSFTLNVINGIYFVNITNLTTNETTVKKLVVRK
jgi:hypothetical protein